MWRACSAVAWLVLSGCQPTFEATGALTVNGESFTPAKCRAMSEATGIEVVTPSGGTVQLTLPPQTVKAFETVRGDVTVTPGGDGPRPSSPCGTLELRGEGYHGGGRRAVSGKVSLRCEQAQGELTFSGCF